MLRLTYATMHDAARLYGWRTDPVASENSRESAPITFADHLAWLAKQLDRSDRGLYVASDPETSRYVGTCRADVSQTDVTLSIAVDPRYRGHGYAEQMLTALMHRCAEHLNGRVFRAVIKDTNVASLRAFWSVGFRLADSQAGRLSGEVVLEYPSRHDDEREPT